MKAIEVFTNHRQMLADELKMFVETYNGPNPDYIKALADKIENICVYIGSPGSVMQMLRSIVEGKIKKWSKTFDNAGKILGIATKKDLERYARVGMQSKEMVVGHFRWNHQGYILGAAHITHIKNFYFSGENTLPGFDPASKYDKQAANFLKEKGAEISLKLLRRGKYFNDDKEERHIYEVTLKRGVKSFTFTFGQSIIGTQNNETPSAYDILSCMTKYDPGSFKDFCADFGYDEDSRSAEKTYHAVVNEYKELSKLFNEQELEEMQEIQ